MSHHHPSHYPAMFSNSIFSKTQLLVHNNQRKKLFPKFESMCYLHTYIQLFGRHQNATSSSFSAHSLSPQNPILPSCQQTSSSKVSHIAYADIYVRLLLLLLLLTRTKAGIAVSSNGDSRSKSPIRESVTREEFFWLVSEHTCFG